MAPLTETRRDRFEIRGVVQGVGFRPFIHRLASELELQGHVGNDSTKVFIEVEGRADRVDSFGHRLQREAPPLAWIEHVARRQIRTRGDRSELFEIVESEDVVGGARTLVPADSAVCDACVNELFDPKDRRHGHPFITCTNCGPRFTIIERLPYDRQHTSMSRFEMCAACRSEYENPTDRRYHAQPIGCHDCGPRLQFRTGDSSISIDDSDAAIVDTVRAFQAGEIVAIKGIGGYHLACDARDDLAVEALRSRKCRLDKPFAVLISDLGQARALANVSEAEAAILSSPQAPIVLLERRPDSGLCEAVAPGNPLIGLMVAHTPVHHLLFAEGSPPLVLTSANRGGEPLAHNMADLDELSDLFDAVLDHDRPINAPCDDSVVRLVGNYLLPLRRAKGYAPIPVRFPHSTRPVLGVGGELKNTFCLAADGHAWVSQHVGDMENLKTVRTFGRSVEQYRQMYGVAPELVAADAHPDYHSSRWARREYGDRVIEVQHHHAHVAAVMAEHQLDPAIEVLGFAFDGTGHGPDGTIWGGEVLRANGSTMERLGHLSSFLLPGGDSAVKNPGRVALAQLFSAGIEWEPSLSPALSMSDADLRLLRQQFERGVACVPCTSMGRLFDAVASILGLRQTITYEAQAAIELEMLASSGKSKRPRPYQFMVDATGLIDARSVLAPIVTDIESGEDPGSIAWSFHWAVAGLVEEIAVLRRQEFETKAVILSGGVFQNALLVSSCMDRLDAAGFEPLTHSVVPPNDGGLALGQAYVAAHLQEI